MICSEASKRDLEAQVQQLWTACWNAQVQQVELRGKCGDGIGRRRLSPSIPFRILSHFLEIRANVPLLRAELVPEKV